MKLRVVGWIYPFYNVEEGEASWAVRNAIIDEIRKRGYDFTGTSHQDYECTPVLNNGKKYLFSSRGWGDIMAEAHGHTGCMDYTMYDFAINPRREIMPDSSLNEFDTFMYSDEGFDFEEYCATFFDESDSDELKNAYRERLKRELRPLIPETDLGERFELYVSSNVMEDALSTGNVRLTITPQLRYLDAGDTLALCCNGVTNEFAVLRVQRTRDLTEEKLTQLQYDMLSRDRDKSKRAHEELDNAQMILSVNLQQVTK